MAYKKDDHPSSKLAKRSQKYVFVGYTANGYRLWDRTTRKIVTSSRVIFDEQSNFSNKAADEITVFDTELERSHGHGVFVDFEHTFCGNQPERTPVNNNNDPAPELVHQDEEHNDEVNPVDIIENAADLNPVNVNDVNDVELNPEEVSVNRDISHVELLDIGREEEVETDDFPAPLLNHGLRGRSKLKEPSWLNGYVSYFATAEDGTPTTYQEAILSPEKEHWLEAIARELEVLNEAGTWDEVDLPHNTHQIDCKWVFKLKRDEDYKITQYKARLVAKGFQQKDRFKPSDIYAPVAKLATLRTLLAVSNHHNFEVHQMDVTGAFLYGDINEDVFMRYPAGVPATKGKTLKLRKSLYGLKKSPKYWNSKFNTFMTEQGFERSKSDYCLYVKHDKSREFWLYVLLYVDDLLLAGSNQKDITDFKAVLKSTFKMKDLGAVSNYLGIHIEQNLEKQEIRINQTAYLKGILKKFNMTECKSKATPMMPGAKLCHPGEEPKPEMETRCRSLIGSLQYAALGSRPDLCAPVNILSRYQDKPTKTIWGALKHLLRYISGTVQLNLIYRKSEQAQPILGYADSDWGNDQLDFKSTSGYLFCVYGNCVAWSSKKQEGVAISSTEAEIKALTRAITEALWLKKVLSDLHIPDSKLQDPIVIKEDNQSAIKFSHTPENSKGLKHIHIKHHFIKYHIEKNDIAIEYVPSGQQLADLLTKQQKTPALVFFRKQIGLE